MPASRLLNETVPTPEAIVRVLEDAGIRFVFGMPGGRTIPIYNALYDHRSKIRTVLVREEGLAAVMADVHGRLTGRPAVAMGQAAFMLTNAGMGILEAFLAGSPMLVLSDLSDGFPYTQHAPYQSGTGDYGSWDAAATIKGYTKRTFVARDPVAAVQETQMAVKHATNGQPGPVAVLFHSTSLAGTVGPETAPQLYSAAADGPRSLASEADLNVVVGSLAASERPVVIAGNGVRMSGAQSELRRFAENLGAAVATTAAGKGVFPETHPLALGVFGTFGLEAANRVVSEADLIVAVGTKLGPTDTANENSRLIDPERQTLIQVDIEPLHIGWSIPVQHSLSGDATLVLGHLNDALRRAEIPPRDGRERARQAHASQASFDVPGSSSDSAPIAPQRLIKELHRAAPSGTIVTCDAGENRLFMMHHFQTKEGMEYLQPAAVGGMGYAIPAALAASLIHPDRPAVAVCGDGGFGIGMNGLMTAIDEHIKVVVVVMNNSALGWVRHGQGERPIASEFAKFDHAAIARAMGCEGIRVERPDELPAALERALKSQAPAVVDVVTSGDYTFRDVTSPLAQRG